MALIYPSKQYTDFNDSTGEEIVYDELKEKLPDSYKVYHSEDWFRAMGQSSSDQERGEIDFLVCHQENGILALEVKGGGIEYDPVKDQWWTIGDEGRERLDKSPAAQAQAGQYCLLNRLKEHPKIEGEDTFSGIIGWGLVFPQMRYEDGLDLPDMTLPRERILFHGDRENLQESLEELYEFWDSEYSFTSPIDDSTWHSLNQSFMRRKFRILESLESYVDRAEDVIYRMTEDQKRLINNLRRQNEVYVRGCAGSGKTLLSREKARRLSEEGKDV
ncbi:MAG: NERD domain-containing protein, partial [bacterium]